jgi:aryl-alcohol dehydrogenase-like predicted oxidoreductase
MKLHPLGSTNLLITPIGLGLAALGRPGYINLGHAGDLQSDYDVTAMQAHAHRVLNAAYDAGVRYFDAARSYGLAEQFLGTWLEARQFSPASVAVGSKWGYTYTADWQVDADFHEVKEHSLSVLRRQWGESQSHLGDYLDLYQVHSATIESAILENREVHAELARLKEAGILIGLSVSGPRQGEVLRHAMDVNVNEVRLFDCVQATWNLLERSAGPALSSAWQAGMGVIVKEALANGRLTERNREPAFAGRLALIEREAQRLGTTVDGLALAGVLAHPWVDVVLSGAARADHLLSNLNALEVSWDDEAQSHLQALVEPAGEYWRTRSDLEWN